MLAPEIRGGDARQADLTGGNERTASLPETIAAAAALGTDDRDYLLYIWFARARRSARRRSRRPISLGFS